MRKLLVVIFLMVPALVAALEINTATRAQLEQLQGLGVATVERILQARGERPFSGWDDLAARVAGLRGKRAAQLDRQGLTVNGAPLPVASANK